MTKLPNLALLSCVLALSACSTYEGVIEDLKFMDWTAGSGPSASQSENFLSSGCPEAGAVPELGTFADFTDNTKPSGQTLISYAKIGTIQSKCDYGTQSVTVDIKLAFEGTLGPAGRASAGTMSYPFFVAVTSPGGAILAKEVFSANMDYSGGQTNQTYFESMRQIIPIQSKDAGKNFKVLAGFQLTPEQLNYNRAVIAADEAARKEREKIQEAQNDQKRKAAKLGASSADPEVIIVPDTMNPSSTPEAVQSQPLNAPVTLAPASR